MQLLRFTTAGSVDDGKSTLIGRLLYDSKSIFEDQLEAVEEASRSRGNEEVNLALLTDGLRAEREQGITIDVAYRYFATPKRKFIIADTPGHIQYTRNMVTGASTADLAVILVDARHGIMEQTVRHSYIASLLAIKEVVVCVNKMDLVEYSREVFEKIVSDYTAFLQTLPQENASLSIPDVQCFPLSALEGDNVVEKSDRTPWYEGPALLDYLETVQISEDHNMDDFRFPVQYVLRPNLDFRGFCGKVASGIIRVGDEVMALPSGKKSHVKSIVTYDGNLDYAFPPQSVTLTLEDEIDISRGEMIVRPDNLPHVGRLFETMLVWMDEEAMDASKSFYLKQTTNTTRCRIDHIKHKVNVNTMERSETDRLILNEIGQAVIATSKELFYDAYHHNKATGAFVLIDPITNNTSAVGMILSPVEETSLHTIDSIPTLDLAKLGIAPEHHEAIRQAVKELERQGLAVRVM